jgi:hypothetical protein
MRKVDMKKYVSIVLVLAGLASIHAASAADGASRVAKMDACFRAHVQLMEKPALKNVQACWRAHGG